MPHLSSSRDADIMIFLSEQGLHLLMLLKPMAFILHLLSELHNYDFMHEPPTQLQRVLGRLGTCLSCNGRVLRCIVRISTCARTAQQQYMQERRGKQRKQISTLTLMPSSLGSRLTISPPSCLVCRWERDPGIDRTHCGTLGCSSIRQYRHFRLDVPASWHRARTYLLHTIEPGHHASESLAAQTRLLARDYQLPA